MPALWQILGQSVHEYIVALYSRSAAPLFTARLPQCSPNLDLVACLLPHHSSLASPPCPIATAKCHTRLYLAPPISIYPPAPFNFFHFQSGERIREQAWKAKARPMARLWR